MSAKRYLPVAPVLVGALMASPALGMGGPTEIDTLEMKEDDLGERLSSTPFGKLTCNRADLIQRITVFPGYVRVLPQPNMHGVAECRDTKGHMLRVEIANVNDPPHVTLGAPIRVAEDSKVTEFPGWALLAPGPYEDEIDEVRASFDCGGAPYHHLALDPTGMLRFRPATDFAGTLECSVMVTDRWDKSAPPQNLSISVGAEDDPPSFAAPRMEFCDTIGTHVERVAWASAISAGPGEDGGGLRFEVKVDRPELFDLQPVISRYGTLEYQTRSDAHGVAHAEVTLWDGEQSHSTDVLFTLGRNHPPSFSLLVPDVRLDEDGPVSVEVAHDISLGANEPDQTGEFEVVADDVTLFASPPRLGLDGVLHLEPAPDRHGSTNLHVTLRDDAGTDNRSPTVTVEIVIDAINDPPVLVFSQRSFEGVEDQPLVLGAADVLFSAGGDAGDELPPRLSVRAVGGTLVLRREPVYDVARAAIAIEPAADSNGELRLQFTATDAGKQSVTREVLVRFLPVNDPPSFRSERDVQADGEGPQRVVWAREIRPGPPNESGQNLRIDATWDRVGAFKRLPTFGSDGVMEFELMPGESEPVQGYVTVRDNGTNDRGGSHAARPATLRIIPPSADDAVSMTPEGGDWLSTIAIEYYGEEGRALWPWVCSYNQERHRVRDCDWIEPGEEILLPSRRVLHCRVSKSFGAPCGESEDEAEAEMMAALPPTMRRCVDILQRQIPDARTGFLIMVAKAIDIEVRAESPDYLRHCSNPKLAETVGFEKPQEDYFTIDASGEPVVVHHWGADGR